MAGKPAAGGGGGGREGVPWLARLEERRWLEGPMRERERREGVLCHTSDQTETTDRRTALMQRSHTVITGDYNYSTVLYSTVHTYHWW